MSEKILWLDTETTGLSSKKHGLREVGYVMVIDGEVVKQDVLYIDPRTYLKKNVEIDPKALELSGKTIKDFDKYPDSGYSFDKFIATMESYIDAEDKDDYFMLAGYNVKFDNDFIREWFYDFGHGDYFKKYFHYKVLDVFPLVITLKQLGYINTENDKLETVCKYFNIEIDAHNAIDDILATKKLYELITSRFISNTESICSRGDIIYYLACIFSGIFSGYLIWG